MSEQVFAKSRIHDLAGTAVGLFALGMLLTSPLQVDTTGPDPFYKGPLIFPLIVFSLMLAGALPSMWRLVRPGPGASWVLDGRGRPKKQVLLLILLGIYVPGLLVLGLEVSTVLFLALALKVLNQDTRRRMLFFPAGVSLALFLAFRVGLDIWFPRPLVMELISALAG